MAPIGMDADNGREGAQESSGDRLKRRRLLCRGCVDGAAVRRVCIGSVQPEVEEDDNAALTHQPMDTGSG